MFLVLTKLYNIIAPYPPHKTYNYMIVLLMVGKMVVICLAALFSTLCGMFIWIGLTYYLIPNWRMKKEQNNYMKNQRKWLRDLANEQHKERGTLCVIKTTNNVWLYDDYNGEVILDHVIKQ